jgi:YHS domain-containing protein
MKTNNYSEIKTLSIQIRSGGNIKVILQTGSIINKYVMRKTFSNPFSTVFSKIAGALFIPLALLASSCNQQPKEATTFHSPAYSASDTAKPKFTRDMVDNLKDPSCGMPLTAGIDDTLHYNGKVYGFCSDECRDEFRKNPKELAKTAVMKK